METTFYAAVHAGGVEIPNVVIDALGSELKSTCINDVWILISNSMDTRFPGELMPSCGQHYYLPENQLTALKILQWDEVKLVFSDQMKTVVLLKIIDIGLGREVN